eukprot:TRINITY_DN136803_c0_g1_i1.p1 TRINITY_DN136803_c0_g1~~TRINITY_DN136803_c0_g1_i1.p1  ORF type:complete len:106 (-),score=10.38 TRINITY_DN136803_c0_g1_i1:42-359(-)
MAAHYPFQFVVNGVTVLVEHNEHGTNMYNYVFTNNNNRRVTITYPTYTADTKFDKKETIVLDAQSTSGPLKISATTKLIHPDSLKNLPAVNFPIPRNATNNVVVV